MKVVPPSDESVRLARIAFCRLGAAPATLVKMSLYRLGLRQLSDYPYSRTRLLLQAAHEAKRQ